MSTNPQKQAPDKPDDQAVHVIVDEQTGVYGWFRRHQKKLLYSVGMFVLLVFSVIVVNFLVDLAYAAVDPRLRARA